MKEYFLLEGVLGSRYSENWWRSPRNSSELWSQPSGCDSSACQTVGHFIPAIRLEQREDRKPILEKH